MKEIGTKQPTRWSTVTGTDKSQTEQKDSFKESEQWPNKYTQRDWDRTVGWGQVPDEYKKSN